MKTKNTGIRIEAIQEVSDSGEPGYRIIKIQALTKKELPKLYLKGEKPVVYFESSPDRLFLSIGTGSVYSARFYTAEDMEKINAHVKIAGQHLADVNAHLCKERESWQGKVVFVDGKAVQAEAVPSENPEKDIPIPLAEKIAELWGEGKLLYRDGKGHIRPLKP